MKEKKPQYADIDVATLRMVAYPEKWPKWPFLPLKKYSTELGHMPDLGYMFTIEFRGPIKGPFKIKLGNVFAPKKDDPVAAIYDSVAELMAAGWRVD